MLSLACLAAIGAASFLLVMLFVPPVSQSQEYHNFADRREWIRGIPNTVDVLSNLPFIVVGIVGIVFVRSIAAYAFFIGSMLTGVGSAIYHLKPDDRTLVYDRLGMTVAFMSFLALIMDGSPLLLSFLLVIGVGSIVWWRRYDDLRPYGWVQFFPLLALATLLTRETAMILGVIVAYGVAKALEHYDARVYAMTRHTISGHTLKHLASACAPLIVLWWIVKRTSS